ncbi:MAG: hypothetical protein PHQ74_11320 [Crocinitomicaceae bacterium]|nr:hypothetical protein [Crocinitomicaceae bacterium]
MTNWAYFIKNYLSVFDVLSAFIWLMILVLAVFYIQRTIQDDQMRRLYGWNFIFKLIFALAFVFYYAGVFRGGDTINYWNTANLMADMFYKSPRLYFQHLMSENNMTNLYYYFNSSTGYPSSDIYYSPENYFTSKVFSVIAILTFKSYLAGTFIMVFFTANAHWRFFKMIKKIPLKTSTWMPVLVLFMPSVAFWSSGISKDTLMLIATFSLVFWTYSVLLKHKKINVRMLVIAFLYIYLVVHVRSTILAIVVVPFLVTGMRQVYQLLGDQKVLKIITKVVFNFSLALGIIFFLLNNSANEVLRKNEAYQTALITQDDFTNNLTYGKNKYNLEMEGSGIVELLVKAPMIIGIGIYRPFIWEALSVSLIINGIESVVLMFFSGRFVFNRFFQRIRTINREGFLSYSFVFVMLTAFISGFISIIFGVLVRFRAPLLPFLGLLLTVEPGEKEEEIAD